MLKHAFVDLKAKIFQGEKFQIGHKNFDQPTSESILLSSSFGCDSTVNLELSFYEVFIPNAITPNGDGLNDSFVIYGSSELVSIRHLALYNKWGDRVFEAESLAPGDLVSVWQENQHASDVYGYVVSLEMDDGKLHQLTGSFLLIR
jgi:gliding motility-associated-like protein